MDGPCTHYTTLAVEPRLEEHTHLTLHRVALCPNSVRSLVLIIERLEAQIIAWYRQQ